MDRSLSFGRPTKKAAPYADLDDFVRCRMTDELRAAVNDVIPCTDIRIGHISAYRLSRTEFTAYIPFRTEYSREGFISADFDCQRGISHRIRRVFPGMRPPKRGLIPLDRYLVPVMTSVSLDAFAEEMLLSCGEDPSEPHPLNVPAFARRYGLSVSYLPLYGRDETDSLLVLWGTDLDIDMGKGTVPMLCHIPPDTIVVNTSRLRREYSGFNILHECVHYELHFLFSALQKEKGLTATGNAGEGPVLRTEQQADRGAMALLMPSSSLSPLIDELCAKYPSRNKGEMYEAVGRELSRICSVPHFRARARMIQLGHIGAKGALNYVGKRLISPFSFDISSLEKPFYTYVLSPSDARELYGGCPAFRRLMDSGRYVYADGHIALNSPRYVENVNGRLMLTAHGRSHAERCCLRFERSHGRRMAAYEPGILHFDAQYAERCLFYTEDIMRIRGCDELEAQSIFERELPADLESAFDLIMRKNKMTREDVAEILHIDARTLDRRLADPVRKISPDMLVILCLIFRTPDWLSYMLFDRARRSLSPADPRDRALRFILRAMWTDGIDKANDYLKRKGFERLEG